jgi:tetratricopeptide (TPR) repeat protein
MLFLQILMKDKTKKKVMKELMGPEGRTGLSGRYLKVALAVVFLALSSFAFGQSPEVRQAFRLLDIEQPAKGISALEKLPSNSTNQYYLGLGYLRTGNKDKALAAFEKGISMSDKDGLNYAGKGHVKLLDKNVPEAKANFDKALAVSKQKDINVLKAVAAGYLADTKFVVDAINLLNKAKGMNGADPEVHMLLGDAYLMQNNGGESVNSYERAAAADQKNAKAHFKVAKVYERSKNNEMVKEYLNKAVTIDPEFGPAWKELAEVYYIEKQADKAVQASDKYVSITENKEDAKYFSAFVKMMAKRFDEANQIFQEVLSKPNAPAVAYRYAGMGMAEQYKDDTAKVNAVKTKELFDKYFSMVKPENLTAVDYKYYGQTLLKLKSKESDSLAIAAFASGLALDSAQTDILQVKGDAELRAQKFGDAVKTFKSLMALRKQPLSQDLWSIGRAYYYNDQYLEADTAFAKLAEKQPAVIHGWLWSAKSRAQVDSTGEKGFAIPMYEKVIEIASKSPDKYKKELIEAYDYLGQYALHRKDNVMEAKGYYEKILALDPTNARAKEFMNVLKQAGQQQKGGR